ncbi:hypothetical protein SARC_13702, partial [Sphaeroforma arctica JP610]
LQCTACLWPWALGPGAWGRSWALGLSPEDSQTPVVGQAVGRRAARINPQNEE